MSSTNTTFETRLMRLEIANKVLVLVALLGIGIVAVRTNDRPDVIQARTIQLLDAQDRIAAELAIRNGETGLYVMDIGGKTRDGIVLHDELVAWVERNSIVGSPRRD